ncbi:pre-mRNA-splicing factor 38B-like [Zophobas morio]|uniref:pre-mRNA-splicing factor 38B-like n=1 Tax=Zophobas morio TaxID=2755281 RepID=UPI0030835CAD
MIARQHCESGQHLVVHLSVITTPAVVGGTVHICFWYLQILICITSARNGTLADENEVKNSFETYKTDERTNNIGRKLRITKDERNEQQRTKISNNKRRKGRTTKNKRTNNKERKDLTTKDEKDEQHRTKRTTNKERKTKNRSTKGEKVEARIGRRTKRTKEDENEGRIGRITNDENYQGRNGRSTENEKARKPKDKSTKDERDKGQKE